MPLKKLSNKEYKRMYKPWITNGIVNSISRKNKLLNKYTKTNAQKIMYFEEYNILRNTINELLRSKKAFLLNITII